MRVTFKAVIFDFGGVFTTSPVENFTIYEKAHGLPEKFIGGVIKSNLHDGAFARFERSEISFEIFSTLFAKETRAAGHEITGSEFIALLDVALKPEMVEALRGIRSAGLRTACITNNFEGIDPIRTPRKELGQEAIASVFELFDHVIESSKAGVRKPEPRIYKMMLERLSVPAKDCIFLDDLGVNLKPAKEMGMRTIKVAIGDVKPAIRELSAALGIQLI